MREQNEFEEAESSNLKRLIKQVLTDEGIESSTEIDIDSEGDSRYQIAKLSYKADNTAMVNKINELINEFNKSLIDNRV